MTLRPLAACAVIVISLPATALSQDYAQDALCVDGSDAVCSQMPADLTGLTVSLGYTPDTNASNPGTSVRQPNFDYLAWQMFVALNWPANADGTPSTSTTITNDTTSPRVWEFYETVAQVYPGNNVPSCAGNGRVFLGQTGKFTVDSNIEPSTIYPLIDTAGNYVMYDIRIGPAEAEYIRANSLDTKAGQQAFGQAWDLPRGLGTAPGAMEMKSSWRIFPSGTDTSGYFTLPATVEVDATHSATGEQLCLDVTLGLVGMHLIQKISTPSNFSDYWVWGTFEHKDNAPLAKTASVSQLNDASTATGTDPLAMCEAPDSVSQSYAFYDPSCTDNGAACAPNGTPPEAADKKYLWQAEPPYAESYLHDGQFGTQVVRCWQPYPSADTVTGAFQAALSGSVWENYRLIGAQWAQESGDGQSKLSPYSAPYYLTNSTMETYLQLNDIMTSDNPGSCIACHNVATDQAGNRSDFSFLGYYAN